MSYLCMDEDGNVYVAATHRSDGLGVESKPESQESFASQLVQNPYLSQEVEASKETAQLAALNRHQDDMTKKQALYARAKRTKLSGHRELSHGAKDKLLGEALAQQMGSADFDQLSIVDAQYGARHAAMLQNMGEVPVDTDLKYISEAEYVSPLEFEQIKMKNMSNDLIAHETLMSKINQSQEQVSAPSKSSLDAKAQEILSGEISFETEDEAKIFAAMPHGQQIAYLRAKKGETYLASTSEASATAPIASNKTMVYGGIALLMYLLLK